MGSIAENLQRIRAELPGKVTLVAVSKTKPPAMLMEAYGAGQRIFGENRIQEMVRKAAELPRDMEWHMIGHLQRNKVKYIAAFVSCIHSVDSLALLQTIDTEAAKHGRTVRVLLQFHIAQEQSKYGLTEEAAAALLCSEEFKALAHVRIAGVMGMATFTDDGQQVRKEFGSLKSIFLRLKEQFFASQPSFKEISMGMSGDYQTAIEEGSTMVRVGSAIFGKRG